MTRKPNPFERFASLFGDPKSHAPQIDNKPTQKLINPWIILAIGNPGPEYVDTRHNVGWWTADILRERLNARLQDEGPSRIARIKIDNQPAIIAYPKTYVNRSGAAARALIRHYETDIDRLIVITDDINLQPGRIRVRRGGGDGGHNGLKSIIDALNDTDFPRVRIGIGKPSNGDTQIDHVLGRPSDEDFTAIRSAISQAARAIPTIVTQGVEDAMNEFNSNLPTN